MSYNLSNYEHNVMLQLSGVRLGLDLDTSDSENALYDALDTLRRDKMIDLRYCALKKQYLWRLTAVGRARLKARLAVIEREAA